jgi:hypothetical protein
VIATHQAVKAWLFSKAGDLYQLIGFRQGNGLPEFHRLIRLPGRTTLVKALNGYQL